MLSRYFKITSLIFLIPCLYCQSTQSIYPELDRYAGLSFVAPPDPFEINPMSAVQSINANTIAVIPFGFTRQGEPSVQYNISQWQWWGERPEGIIESIRLAHKHGIKVMVKPQIYIPGSWTGALDFDSNEKWNLWEKEYENYILEFAQIADSMQVELFCIGTELKLSVEQRPQFWKKLISKVKAIFTGKITYAANWDDFEIFPFWDQLDFIGVDAYFPLSKDQTPKVKELIQSWQPHLDKIEKLTLETKRPLIFTEYGYLSVDHCADETWELEKRVKSLPINEHAQANALEALYQVFYHKPYWKGGFLWKWFPNGQGHEGYLEKDYTPQDKISFHTVSNWYDQF